MQARIERRWHRRRAVPKMLLGSQPGSWRAGREPPITTSLSPTKYPWMPAHAHAYAQAYLIEIAARARGCSRMTEELCKAALSPPAV
jgi:hypothetical protein